MVSFLLKVTLAVVAVGVLISGIFESKLPPPPPPPPPPPRSPPLQQEQFLQPSSGRQQDYRSERPPQPENLKPENSTDYYNSLRRLARTHGDKMTTSSRLSREAYKRGERRHGEELKDNAEKHKKKMEALDLRASDWIFKENNRGNQPGKVDLHGLFVKEAETRAETSIQQARQRGDAKLVLIVGRGRHSPGGESKLKPAIEELVKQHGLYADYHRSNDGQLIVHMDRRR